MRNLSNGEKELNKRKSEVFLYEFGQVYTDIICNEADLLRDKYSDLSFPDSMDVNFESYIQQIEKLEKSSKRKKQLFKISKTAAIFLLTFIMVSATLILTVEAFRIKVFNFVIETNDRYTDLSIVENNRDDVNNDLVVWEDLYYPEYIPKDYSVYDYIDTEAYKEVHFIKGDNVLSLYLHDGTEEFISYIDTEGVDISYININGHEAVYISKAGNITIAWNEGSTLIKVIGSESREEMIKISKSIKKQE